MLISWFGGQEMADALADVLTGAADPGGRLPMTFPAAHRAQPRRYGNFPGENGEVRYGEGVLVGYRWYDARAPARRASRSATASPTRRFEIGEPRLGGRLHAGRLA